MATQPTFKIGTRVRLDHPAFRANDYGVGIVCGPGAPLKVKASRKTIPFKGTLTCPTLLVQFAGGCLPVAEILLARTTKPFPGVNKGVKDHRA